MTTLDCVIRLLRETGVEGWSCGETWESIKFPEGYEKPPKEEFEAKLQELMAAQSLKELRQERDKRLAACDWTQLPNVPLPGAKKYEWETYRQTLRDLPSTTEDPTNPVWPVRPDEVVPVEETPTEETSVEETPVEETPVEETPTEETPTE